MKNFFKTLLLATVLFNMSNSLIINKENNIVKDSKKEILTKSKQYKIKSLEGVLGW